MKEFHLEGKVAVVTGGATGIGRAIATMFTAAGAMVSIVGRKSGELEEACEDMGGGCHEIIADLKETHSIPGIVERIEKEVGPVNILVNNAGINQKKPALDVSDEEFSEIIGINLASVFALSRECARYMSLRKSGSILNISSMAALYGIPQVVSYSASKSGLVGLTRSLATEWAAHGIRVNAIAPGFIRTAMSEKALSADPERSRRVMERTPMARLGDPDDIARAALFLSSDAASYITGVVLPVDGGNSIGF